MAQYIILINWTDQGIRNVKESPKRLDAAREEHGSRRFGQVGRATVLVDAPQKAKGEPEHCDAGQWRDHERGNDGDIIHGADPSRTEATGLHVSSDNTRIRDKDLANDNCIRCAGMSTASGSSFVRLLTSADR